MEVSSLPRLPESLNAILSRVLPPQLSALNAAVACAALLAFVGLVRMSRQRRALRTTKLRGPPSPSFTYGVGKTLMECDDPALKYEAWAQEYGSAYAIPSTLGTSRILLYDPKAIAHFHAKETWTYVRTPLTKKLLENGFGRGLFWAEGESHRRQRKSLTPAFSIAALRKLTPIFYDSAYKAKGTWNALIESTGEDNAVIDVQSWMNYISLDTIGLAGFSHDFGALDGKRSPVTLVFDSFTSSSSSSALNVGLGLLAQVFPILASIPTPRGKLVQKLNTAMEDISNALLARTKKELEMGIVGDQEEKSVIGLLIKGASVESEFHLTTEEVLAQMKVLLLAGYETTSISLTWALIELCRNPEMQVKLRKELLEHGSDPTYDQLTNGLPYLDAVVHEVFRMHPPIRETVRSALEDDVIPLSEPVRTQTGELVDSLSIAKGTAVVVPFSSINLSADFWGEDAKEFKPSRWLEEENGSGIPAKAREVSGHRHLLTFSDGPRTCLGKNFAVAEFKAVLSVLIRNFVFELRGDADKIEMGRGFLPRPRTVGEEGCKVPLRVRAYMG